MAPGTFEIGGFAKLIVLVFVLELFLASEALDCDCVLLPYICDFTICDSRFCGIVLLLALVVSIVLFLTGEELLAVAEFGYLCSL